MRLKDIRGLYNAINRGYTLTDKRHFYNIQAGHYHIWYRHYGSSAIKNNLKDFRWLINTIYKDYTVNDFIIE
jgi:hypothetical protein